MAKERGTTKEKSKGAIKRKTVDKVVITRLNIENTIYRNALLKFHGICDCRVVLKRLPKKTAAPKPPQKKLLSAQKVKSVRIQVPWLPTTASTKSSATMGTNDLLQSKPAAAKRTRSQSLHHERPVNDNHHGSLKKGQLFLKSAKIRMMNPLEQKSFYRFLPNIVASKRQRLASISNDDLHQELLEKANTPNRSLRPVDRRSIPEPIPEPLPEWKIIFNEFQRIKAEREEKKVKESF